VKDFDDLVLGDGADPEDSPIQLSNRV